MTLSLEGKKGIIVGIANENSIAYGCAKVLKAAGAELAVTYLNEKSRQYVEPLAEALDARLFLPLNVESADEMENVFQVAEETWGEIDFVVHSIAWSPLDELHGRVVDSSSAGFCRAMDISCHSLVRMAKLAEPLMKNGGSIITMSYYGSEKVVDHYNMMGPIKAALESTVRYLSAELGEKNIRVNSVSPGPMMTRAASGIDHFDELVHNAENHSPLHRLGTPEEVGNMAAFLVSPMSSAITGGVHYVDAGHHIMA
ncbi:enoyl-ACP reductase FabI [Oceanospirillum sediminis]|uniref:Enoyl-[acyl-carrier-protein] reductase [NADH] n=1 Tax=Oceanospirillum sediminis TaxID=2760088 RepID=A0A839IP02_9GAMM|nr:enoyl-ACP reductase FabI [Oceanospirillum sediminis]MBB1486414.1 enoyl-ACP reductase FabI [Oceanospirillum sediminis]